MRTDKFMPRADELARERAALRRGLGRSRLAAVAVLLIAAALGSVAVVAALRAQSNAADAEERLWQSLVSQARAERLSGEVGGRTKALAAIREAAAIRPTADLRDEAIAALSLIDLGQLESWPGYPEDGLKLAFSPDLSNYAVDFGRRIEIFATATRRSHASLIKRADLSLQIPFHAEQLLFSPDEKLLAGMYWGAFVVVWDVEAKRELWRERIGAGDPDICGLSFDGASGRLAVSTRSESCVRIHDARTGELQLKHRAGPGLHTIALSPDGRMMAWADGSLHVGPLGGEEVLEVALPSAAMELRWAPGGARVAVGCFTGEVQITDVEMGTSLVTEPVPSTLHGMDFHPGGRFLMATGWDGATRLWDTHQATLRAESRNVYAVKFDRGGGRLATKREYAETGIWKFTESSVHHGYAAPGGAEADGLNGLDISPDGRWLVAQTRAGGKRYVWDRESCRIVAEGPSGVVGSFFSGDGRWLYSVVQDGLQRWPIVAGERFALGEPEVIHAGDAVWRLRAGTDGRKWANALAPDGRGLRIDLDVPEPALVTVLDKLPAEDGAGAFTQSADGRWAVISYWDGRTTQLWDLPGKRRVKELDVFGGSAEFLPGGHYLAVGNRRGLAIWDVKSWEREALFPSLGTTSVPCKIASPPDGRYVSYDPDRSSVRLIDTEAMDIAATFVAPNPGRLYDQCFSDDGRFLLVASGYKLDLWDLPALEHELGALGLRFGEQAQPSAAAGAVRFSPTTAASLAAVIMLVALGFGLYSMLYQRRLIRRFDAQYVTLERTQRELAQSEKLKALGTLSAGVAHDFKNLLSVIRLSNDLIRRDIGDRADILEEVDAIGNAVAQGDQVVRAMLGYSRGGSAEGGAVDVAEVIEGTVSLLGQQFLSGLNLVLEIGRDLPAAAIPPGALEPILLNLVVNASEAMAGRGTLTITADLADQQGEAGAVVQAARAARCIRIRVSDSGPGMDGDTLGRIFEPFFTTKIVGAEKGTGLGLATVYKVARDNGLGLAVHSREGEGTCFAVFVPVAE